MLGGQREWLARNVRVRRYATINTLAKVCMALSADIVELLSEPRRAGAH
jgi:hypothetical protein